MKLPASCFTEQTSGEPREILDVVRRGALATETYVFECDEAIGSIEIKCATTVCGEPVIMTADGVYTTDKLIARLKLQPLSFVSTDGELRA